jgi:hypothetical protein
MKKIFAFLLSAALALSMTSVAFAAPGDVTGDGTTYYVDTTLVDMELPTGALLDFTIDPQGLLDLDADGKKLSELHGSGDIIPAGQVNFVNQSTYPVTLGVTLKAKSDSTYDSGTPITFFNDKTAFASANSTQATEDNNNVLLYAAVSSVDISDRSATQFVGLTDGFIFNAIGINNVGANKLSFVLPEAEHLITPQNTNPVTYAIDLIPGSGHGCAILLGGSVNTKADWSAYAAPSGNTIGVDAVFSFAKTTSSDVVTTTKTDRAAVGMLATADAYAVVSGLTWDAGPSATSDVSEFDATTTAVISVDLGTGSAAATSVNLTTSKIVFSTSSGAKDVALNSSTYAPQYFGYDATAKTFTIKPAFFAAVTSSTVKVNFVFDTGDTASVTLNKKP